ncbi:MAG: hypothetical protein RLZZ490_615 [Cyanobacteriota bacterium]|jgi:Na+/proline symporter
MKQSIGLFFPVSFLLSMAIAIDFGGFWHRHYLKGVINMIKIKINEIIEGAILAAILAAILLTVDFTFHPKSAQA